MIFRVLTLFPEVFGAYMNASILGRAKEQGFIQFDFVQIRDYADNKHNRVDDYPFGGGSGMVMQYGPLKRALSAQPRNEDQWIVSLSPRGNQLTHERSIALSKYKEIILVCGHYEGIDQRFIDQYVDEEISIGDYVITGGELAAMVVMDSVSRHIPGVLSNSASSEEESFTNGLLEYDQYTRPSDIDELKVPDVLLSGNHSEIDKWRFENALRKTREKRPDLFNRFISKTHPKEIRKIIEKSLQ